jgi:hypothetical protein
MPNCPTPSLVRLAFTDLHEHAVDTAGITGTVAKNALDLGGIRY